MTETTTDKKYVSYAKANPDNIAPSWTKQATSLLAVIFGIAAGVFPAYRLALIGLSAGLAGWATTHPSESPKEPSIQVPLTELPVAVQEQVKSNA